MWPRMSLLCLRYRRLPSVWVHAKLCATTPLSYPTLLQRPLIIICMRVRHALILRKLSLEDSATFYRYLCLMIYRRSPFAPGLWAPWVTRRTETWQRRASQKSIRKSEETKRKHEASLAYGK